VIRVGALVSGEGRTVLNLLDSIQRGDVEASIDVVLAHREDLPAVERCRGRGLNVEIVGTDPDAIDDALLLNRVELVCLAGYLRKFRVGEIWADRVINIHPALLPKHGGKGMFGRHVHQAVLAAGDQESGCTVHVVDEEYDHGRTLLQRRCPVLAGDSPESLAARVFAEECVAMPEAIAAIAGGEIRLLRSE
jgi:folate-dependent phosphoribosylglycinamide formyltransferase PurN